MSFWPENLEGKMGFNGTAAEWNELYPVGTRVAWDDLTARTRGLAYVKLDGGEGHSSVYLEGLDHSVRLEELSVEPPKRRMAPMAVGRQARADAAIVAAAVELAPLARQLLDRLSSGSAPAGEIMSSNMEMVARMLSLSATIEGLTGSVGIASSEAPGSRVNLCDLVPGGIYVTHFDDRKVEWSMVSANAGQNENELVIRKSGNGISYVNPSDYGLCGYSDGGAWNPHAWTESVGAKVTDGEDIIKMVNAELDDDIDLPDDEEE